MDKGMNIFKQNKVGETKIKWGRRERSVNTSNILMEHIVSPPECKDNTSYRLC